MTGSIAERTIGRPIENLRVMPDIKYELTEKDMRTAFAEYRYAILKALGELRPGPKGPAQMQSRKAS